mmetsp:Transcript_60136/g.156107  ORF Transcript_60136/g.156107 Transcript_60136/m.156107 type:complete len:201 (+) Transcript_60136:332-934(+)
MPRCQFLETHLPVLAIWLATAAGIFGLSGASSCCSSSAWMSIWQKRRARRAILCRTSLCMVRSETSSPARVSSCAKRMAQHLMQAIMPPPSLRTICRMTSQLSFRSSAQEEATSEPRWAQLSHMDPSASQASGRTGRTEPKSRTACSRCRLSLLVSIRPSAPCPLWYMSRPITTTKAYRVSTPSRNTSCRAMYRWSDIAS